MPFPIRNTAFTSSLQPALELIYLATLEPGQASESLRNLLLANPNYFDNLPENSFQVVLNIKGDTAYESLGSISYIPLLEHLYASIKLKRERGYSFSFGGGSSREFVRFYLSRDRGATWHDQGLTTVNVCDEPGANLRAHLVTKKIHLREDATSPDVLPLVRAILSWNSPPPADAPGWTPLWGNVVETQIHPVRPEARRPGLMQAEPPARFADQAVAQRIAGQPFEPSSVRPIGPITSSGLLPGTQLQPEDCRACAV